MENKLTIVVPVYNGEKYIKRCLDSILNVHISNLLEVLVINDGSTDGTKEILEQYNQLARVSIYNNVNQGVSATRNYGISKAKGKYIMFVDADDILDNNWYNLIAPYLNYNDDCIVFNNKILNNSKEDLVRYITVANKEKICIAGPVSKLYKTEFLKKNNILFKTNLISGEDMIFNLDVFFKTNNYRVVKASFYKYRQHMGSATKRFDEKIIDTEWLFHDYLKEIMCNNGFDSNITLEITNFLKLNGILNIINRISYIDSFKKAKNYYDFLSIPVYSEYLNLNSNSNLISKFNKMLIVLCKKERYRLVYFIIKMKLYVKKCLYNNSYKKEYFVEI